MKKPPLVDHFGFLNVPESFTFEGGSSQLSPSFQQSRRIIQRYLNDDGFIYPPMSKRATIDPVTGKRTSLPKTRRPALTHPLPSSHELQIKGVKNIQKSRSSIGGFIIYCFAFLFGTRLQFWDWWFEGRVPIKSTVDIYASKPAAEAFLSKAIDTWKRRLDRRSKKVLTNILYLYSKAGSLEWDWERFQMEYIVFDACYSVARRLDGCPRVPHKKRFKAICKLYKLAYHGKLLRKFVDLRNDFVHEALWDKGQANTARSSQSFIASYHLRRFNHRLITAMVAGESDYTSSSWWFLGTYNFKV